MAVSEKNPTPSGGNQDGTDLRAVASQIDGLLDDDGNFSDGRISRAHPDYDESTDERAQPRDRDERGRFKANQAEEQPEDVVEDTVDYDDADDQQDDIGDAADEDTDESGDTDEQLAASADEQPDSDETETGAIETLAEMADALEVSVDDLKQSITHSFTAAGEDVTVTLAELESGYQKDADYRRSTAQLADERRQASFQYNEKMQQFEQQQQLLMQHFVNMDQMIAAKLEDPNLQVLRDSDPAEWNARQTEIGRELQTLRQMREQTAQQFNEFHQRQVAELKMREMGQLKTLVPDYDDAKANLAKQTLHSLGYVDQEIAHMYDHRIAMAVLELAGLRTEVEQLRAQQQKAQDTVKRIKKDVPKLQKPGKRQAGPSQQTIRRDNVSKLNQRLKKSGRVEDAAKVIENMIFQ